MTCFQSGKHTEGDFRFGVSDENFNRQNDTAETKLVPSPLVRFFIILMSLTKGCTPIVPHPAVKSRSDANYSGCDIEPRSLGFLITLKIVTQSQLTKIFIIEVYVNLVPAEKSLWCLQICLTSSDAIHHK